MTELLKIHPENPQSRLILQAVEMIRKGGVFIYPTDSSYALGCKIGDKAALSRLRQIRGLKEEHHLTVVCKDLSQLSEYAHVSNPAFRLLKAYIPGPYTFILKASSEAPRKLLHPKRKSIGLRVPDNLIVKALLEELGESILSTSLSLPEREKISGEPEEFRDYVEGRVELIIDAGFIAPEYTSIIDLSQDSPVILREGKGDISAF